MADLAPFALVVFIYLLGAAVTTGSPARRALGLAISATAFAMPWVAPKEHLVVRSVAAIFAFGGGMRAVDLVRFGDFPLRARLWHAISVVDSRKLTPAAPKLEGAALARLAGWEAIGAAFYVLVTRVGPTTTGALYWLIRWGGGLALVYTLSEGAYCLLFAVYRLAGFRPPRLHMHPAASRSVQEFWGKRWNLTVSAWLGDTFFRPLARRGHPMAGVLVAFAVSALAHAYICKVALGMELSVIMFGYFCVQGALVAIERPLRVTRWAKAPAHVWTVTCMAVASPMFTEPLLQVLGA